MKFLPLFILIFLMSPCVVQAQFSASDGYPFITPYTTADYSGHPQNWDFAEDKNGIMYIANNLSLIIYDGINWKDINIPNINVYEVAADTNGVIYVGGNDEIGYMVPSNTDSVSHPQYKSLIHLVPDSIVFDRATDIEAIGTTIYFKSKDYLLKYDGTNMEVYQAESYFYDLFTHEGNIYISDRGVGIKTIKDHQLVLTEWGAFFKDRFHFAHTGYEAGELYCSYNKCYRFEDGEFTDFDTEADSYFASKYIDEVITLQDGNFLFASRQGGLVLLDPEGKLIHIIDEEKGLTNNATYELFEDSHGAVWVATMNGISRVEYGLPLRRFDERNGIDGMPMNIFEISDSFYVLVNDGLIHKDRNAQNFEKIGFGDSCYKERAFESDIYIECSGVFHVKGGEATNMSIRNRSVIRKLIPFGNDSFWYANDNEIGMAVMDDETLVPVSSKPVKDLNIDRLEYSDNNLWVSTVAEGLFRFSISGIDNQISDPKRYLEDIGENNTSNTRIRLANINNELLFLTSKEGVLQYDESKDELVLVEKYGPFLNEKGRNYFLAESDEEENIWLRSGNAYQALLKQETGEYELYEVVLNRIDDRQSNDIYADAKGYIWYATDEGLVRYTKNHSFDHTRSFYVGINEVLVRNDSLINGGANTEKDVLDYADNELRFTYAAASYDDPSKTVYRVKLDDFDSDWTAWTAETQKDYTNIPEGDYTFSVQARNVYGVVSESAGFSFSVLPPWYRTWWAYLLYILTGGAILYMAYRIRVNQLLKVHRMRDRIASDLHDEVSATLSSISFFARAIEDKRGGQNKDRFVRLIHESAGEAKEKITDIVWAINPEHDDWDAFLSKCRRYASDLLESKDIKYSLKIDEHIPGKLNMELRQNLWMIYKEMVTNAVRHSEAKQLDVIFTYEEGKVKLVVQDDGKGLDEETIEKGNGLVNIRKRAESINGNISLDSDQGFGTRWSLLVPL